MTCPGCGGTGIIWDDPPEPGEPGDPGVYLYCDCADGGHRKRADARLVDRILTALIVVDVDDAA